MPNATETVEPATTETVEAPVKVEVTPAAPEAAPASPSETPDDIRKQLESANARIKELNKENEKRRKAQEEQERAQQEEQGKFKELYEKTQADLQAERDARVKAERERLIDRIAADNNLPAELRDRLRGETEEELEADAKQLAKFATTTREVPNLDSQKNGTSSEIISDEEQAAYARRYGIRAL